MSISFLAPFLLSMKVSYRQILAEQIELNTIYRKNVLSCTLKLTKSHFSTNKFASIATTIIFTDYAVLFLFFSLLYREIRIKYRIT